jgi:hypothetical protein
VALLVRVLNVYGKYFATVLLAGLVLALVVWLAASVRQWWNDR